MEFMEANPQVSCKQIHQILLARSKGATGCGLAGAALAHPALTVLESGARLEPEPDMGAERGEEEG
jgi:hypothetical protein